MNINNNFSRGNHHQLLTTTINNHNLYDEISEIVPGLFLTSINAVYEPETMRDYSIKAVLSVLSDEPDYERLDGVVYHYIEIDDHEESDLLSRFTDTNRLIHSWRQANRNVLVHCFMGVSRSATIVAAFLMTHLQIGSSQAIDLIRSKRSVISPNSGFLVQLAFFEHLKFNLCSSDIWYRRYLFARLVFSLRNGNSNGKIQCFQPNSDSLKYIYKLTNEPQQEQQYLMTERSRTVYKCKDCRRMLFTSQDVLQKDIINLFVNILPWMTQERNYFFPFGKIYCPHCNRKIGRYKWEKNYLSTVRFKFGSSSNGETSHSQEDVNLHQLNVPMVFSVTRSSVDPSISTDNSSKTIQNCISIINQ